MIKLKYDNRTLYAVVERILIAVSTNPTKVRLVEMIFDLLKAELARLGGQVEQHFIGNGEYEFVLSVVERRDSHTLVGYNTVISERAAEMSLIVLVPSIYYKVACLLHPIIPQLLINLRPPLLLRL